MTKRANAPKNFYTATEAIKRLGMKRNTFFRYVKDGKIKKVIPPGQVEGYYPKAEIDKLARAREAFTINYAIDPSIFRKAEESDIRNIQKLYEDLLRSRGREGPATYEARLGFFKKNPDIFYIVEQEGVIVGYIAMLPLKRETIDRLMPMTNNPPPENRKITSEDILEFKQGEIDNLFLVIEVRQGLSRSKQYAARLLNGGIEILENLGRRGTIIKNLYATSSTPDGIRLCRGLGFDETRSPIHEDVLYFKLDLETSKSPFIEEYQEIAKQQKYKDTKAIIQALLTANSVAVASPQLVANPEPWERLPRATTQPLDMSKEALEYFQQVINTGWHLSNASQDATVERMLPIFIPQLEAAAQQPSKNQQLVCAIVAQGYILASEVDRNNIKSVEHYGNLAVHYSEISNDYNILVAALKQQATIASIAHRTNEALEIYLKTLQYLPFVTPLLTSRVYMGLADTYAKSDTKNSSLAAKYLDLAHETFPQEPEKDTSYLYTTTSGTAILNLYDGLTHVHLGQYQEAWNALEPIHCTNPNIHISESTRIEFMNLQASAAIGLNDLERSCHYLNASVRASKTAGYNLRTSEAYEIYQEIKQKWPNESSVKELIELFH